MTKVAFLYATFPRATETFVRRELRALGSLGFRPDLYSIWQGSSRWEDRRVNLFVLVRLWSLLFWLPYWCFKRPSEFRGVLKYLWSHPCHSFQNWCETFLGLGFALVEAYGFGQRGYRLIHAVWATMPATAAFAISRLQRIEFSMGAHAYDVFRHGGDWLLPRKLQAAKFVRTSSQSTAVRLQELGVEESRIKLVRRSLTTWPELSNLDLKRSDGLKLLSVGRLVEKKGYFHLLGIASLLKEAEVPFSLTVIGSGPLEKDLIMERDRMGLQSEVFFQGALGQEAVRRSYASHDAFLFTGIVDSRGDRDGIPNVVPEAMSWGMLVLASNQAGASEAFTDGFSGYSLDPKVYSLWVSKLKEFWETPARFVPLRKQAIIDSKVGFDSSLNARKLLELFQN